MEQAFGLKDYQIVGAPNWMDSDRWDIAAKSDSPSTLSEKFAMLQPLFADRFQLQYHRETRQLPVYSLVALKDGPKFQQPKEDGTPSGIRINTGLLDGHKFDVSTLAWYLSSELNIPVVDKVGLHGVYDFKLEWTPAENEGNRSYRDDLGPGPAADLTGPSIFTALQEQLGLKLEVAKGPVEVLVIDRIEKPTEN